MSDFQKISVVGPAEFDAEGKLTVTVKYESSSAATTGIGFGVHYDSTSMTMTESIQLVTADSVAAITTQTTEASNPAMVEHSAGYTSLFAGFPGVTSVDLYTLTFEAVEGGPGNAGVYLSYSSNAAGYEPLNDNPIPVPLIVNNVALDENSGDGQVIATVENAIEGAVFTLVDSTDYGDIDDSEQADLPEPTVAQAPTQALDTQHIYVADSQFSEQGDQLILTLGYMSDADALSGVGFSLHFDSSVLALSGVSDLAPDNVASGSQGPETDSDGNDDTDQVLSFGWVSLFGAFPGANQADLATVTFDVIGNPGGNTAINFTDTSVAASKEFEGHSFDAQLPISTQPPLTIDSVTGDVTLNVNPDFESVPQYDFEIVETFGDDVRSSTVSASIGNIDESSPVFAQSSVIVNVSEDAAGAVFTANADDTADASAGVTYSLSGADASLLSIDENSGAVTVTGGLDYEAKASYNFTVTADDGVTSVATQDVTVNVSNLDELAPIFDSAATASVVENSTASFYQAAATDDASDLTSGPITYSLADDANGLFAIDASGNVSLTAAQDYENATPLSFTVRATDGAGNSADQTVTVTVEDADEIGPSITSDAAADVAENTAVGEVVYTATAADSTDDVQAPGDITFSLGAGSDSAVQISSDGQVTLTEEPDFEGNTPSYTFSVIATDAAGNAGDAQTVTLTVTDRPDSKPSWQSANEADAVDENSNPGVVYTAVANAVSAEGEAVTIAQYELTDDAGGLFSVDAATGAVSFNGAFNYEDTTSYSFTLVATDTAGNPSDPKTVTLAVNNLDELAPIVSGQLGAVELTNGTGTNQVVFNPQDSVLGESAVDNANDKSDGLVFALSFDADNQQYADDFAIDAATGKVTYLPDPSGALTINYSVVVTDAAGNVAVDANGDEVAAIPLAVTILNVEYDVPVFATPEGYTAVVETEVVQKAGTSNEEYVAFVQSVVLDGDLSAVNNGDVVYTANTFDASTSLKYSVSSAILVDENVSNTGALFNANAAGSISIDQNSGEVSIHGQPWADGADSYSFTVTATDGTGNESYQIVTLTNLDTYAGAAWQVAEGVTYHIADAQAPVPADADAVGINPEDYVVNTQGLGIDPVSGDVYFLDAADYETQDRYVFKVVGSDGSEQVVSLHVVDTDDVAPVITLENTASSVDENAASGFVVTSVSTSDDSAVTLSLSGDDASSFSIDADGVVTLEVSADHELQSEYNFHVVATDAAGNSSEEAVSLQVNDLDEQGPVFSSASAIRIDENESDGIYTATVHDAGNLVSKGAISQEFVQNDDGTLTVKFSVDSSVYTDASQVEVADFDFSYAADHQGILQVESIVYPSNPMIRLANEQDGQINFALVLSEFNPYTVGGDVALAEVTFKVGDPSVATTFSVNNVILGDAASAELQSGSTVNNYVMTAPRPEGITLSLENPDDGFAIDSDGNVTVSNADADTLEERSFTVVATDAAGNESKQTVSVSLNNLDEVAPEIKSGTVADAIFENSGSGQVVYTATADDSADTSAGVTFSLEGADAGAFVIDAHSGEVTLLDNPDFETQEAYSFTVKAFDGVHSSVQAVTLGVNNVDEKAPTITSGNGSEFDGIDENTHFGDNEEDANNGIIYRATADDSSDISGGVTFTLADTNSEALQINDDGAVFINVAANHESLAQYAFTVVATDAAGNSSREAVTIDVNDLDEVKPVFTSGTTALSIDENIEVDVPGEPVVVYKAIADDSVDAGEGNQVRYELTTDSDDLFTIDQWSGEVTLTRSPDFEHKSNKVNDDAVEGYVHGFEVVAIDSANNFTSSGRITVVINNLDEVAPEITSGDSAGTIVENSGSNQLVYTATASDVHANEAATDGFTFALGGDDADSFTIDAETGEVRLVDNADEDEKSQYSFSVTAVDEAGNVSDAQSVSLTVTPQSQIIVSHLGNSDHLRGVKIINDNAVRGQSNGRKSTAIDLDDDGIANLTLEKDVEASDVISVVNSADALTVLKMSIGLHNVAAGKTYSYKSDLDFDGDNVVNSYDLTHLAADVNGDGKVNSRDALEILKISVRMDDAIESSWMFAKEATDTVQDTMTFEGFIRGDVNNSWNNSDNVSAVRSTDKGAKFTSRDSLDIDLNTASGAIYKAAADDDTYEVSFSIDHEGLEINPAGVVRVVGDISDLQSFDVVATDVDGNVTTQTVTVNHAARDRAKPETSFDELPNVQVEELTTGPVKRVITIQESDAENVVVFKAQANESVEYSLGRGSDPALRINDQGEVILSNAADEDIQSQYRFTLITEDMSGNVTREKHLLNIDASDEVAPVIVSRDTGNDVSENASGDVIYTARATDSDYHGQSSVKYSLQGSPAGLSINEDTGEVTLDESVDYEAQDKITFTVLARDTANNSSSKEVTIKVKDVDERAPELTSDVNLPSIEENSGAAQVVYNAKANDIFDTEVKSGGVSFSLDGADAGSFAIDGRSGRIRLLDNPDYETKSEYNFTLVVEDKSGNTAYQSLVLNISDVDEVAPVITLGDVASSISENSGSGQVAYTVTASDDSTFNLILSTDSDQAISLENGNIVLNENPDHELQSEYNFTVIATDAEGNTSSESAKISIVDVDDANPVINDDTSVSITEGEHDGTVVYSANGDDNSDDEQSALSYEIVVNSPLIVGVAEPVEAAPGVQKVYVGSDTVQDGNQIEVDVDYLADSNELTGLGLRVHYDSSKLSFVEMNNVLTDFLIFESENFVDANDPAASYVSVAWASYTGEWTGGELPENLFSAVFDVLTDETTATQISFSAIDNDMAYEFEGLTHDVKLSPLSIDSATGDVSFDSVADFETLSQIDFKVVATDDAGNEVSKDVVVDIDNTDETAPIITSSDSAGTIVEGSGAGQLIYTATSDDSADVSHSDSTFSLVSENPSLAINSQTGEVFLFANPDYESGDTISFTVVVEDAVGSSSKDVTLSITNIDEVAPVITSGVVASNVDENAPGSKIVYTASAVNNTDTDDVSDLSVSYSLASDSDAAFSINADSGEVSFNDIADYETKSEYSFTVVATDISGESSSQTVTVEVNDLDEVAPTITSSASAGDVNETHETDGSFSSTPVYTATASDNGDISGGFTFALSGADASAFSINEDTGVVTLVQSPNFEAQSSYSFDVVATDDAGNSSAAETVTLTINNVDEIKPEITSSDTAKAVVASDSAAVIYTATAEDSGDGSNGNITFSLTDESVVSINADGEVTVNSDANLSSVVDFTVVATDANGNSSEKAVSIPVISDVTTVSPVTTLGEGAPVNDDGKTVNNGIVHSYTNNSDGSVTLKLAIGTGTGMSDAELTNIDFELSSTSAINKDDFVVSSEPTMHIATQVDPNTIRVSQVYMNGYDTSAGEAILEYTINTPAGDTFSVSSITMGALDSAAVDSSSNLAVLPVNSGTIEDDVVALKDGFANVDLGDGADTLIIDPGYSADMVVDFVSGEDSIDMTQILQAAGYSEGDALEVSGSTPDIADLVSNSDESLDNAFGGYFNDDTDVLTLFVDADSLAGVTNVESIEVTLSDDSDFNDDLSVNFVHFIA
jgi:hypothetical protein